MAVCAALSLLLCLRAVLGRAAWLFPPSASRPTAAALRAPGLWRLASDWALTALHPSALARSQLRRRRWAAAAASAAAARQSAAHARQQRTRGGRWRTRGDGAHAAVSDAFGSGWDGVERRSRRQAASRCAGELAPHASMQSGRSAARAAPCVVPAHTRVCMSSMSTPGMLLVRACRYVPVRASSARARRALLYVLYVRARRLVSLYCRTSVRARPGDACTAHAQHTHARSTLGGW